jgi:hypothetical protein
MGDNVFVIPFYNIYLQNLKIYNMNVASTEIWRDVYCYCKLESLMVILIV